jgi:GT2 family glycosyltransferase
MPAANGLRTELTVAIINWNSGDYLRCCVAALYEGTHVPIRVLVVDNDSTDDSLARLKSSGLEYTLIQTGRNLGYAGGINVALAQAQTPYVVVLNPDAFVHEGCVEAMVRCAKEHPGAAAVGAGLRNSNGSLQPACRNFPTPLTHLIEAFRLYHLLKYVPGLGRWYQLVSLQDQMQQVDSLVGACMLLCMPAVRDVGYFDESYFMYCEELDWCLRARRRGWEIWFAPKAVATHILGGSSSKNELAMLVQGYRSMYRFYRIYYPRSWTVAARLITVPAMLLRALALPLRGRWRDTARLQAYLEIVGLR